MKARGASAALATTAQASISAEKQCYSRLRTASAAAFAVIHVTQELAALSVVYFHGLDASIDAPMETFEAVVAPRIILSDRVIREEGTGKVSLIGCFDSFISQTFPFQSVPFFVTVGVTNIIGFPAQLNVVLRIESPGSGHVVASSQVDLTKKPDAPSMPRHAVVEIVFPFPTVRFDAPGVFDLVCLVSNEVLARRQFEVKPLTVSPHQAQ